MNQSMAKRQSSNALIERRKKHIMQQIKELQRDLIKVSFKQSSQSEDYQLVLQQINKEREKLKQLNQRFFAHQKTQ